MEREHWMILWLRNPNAEAKNFISRLSKPITEPDPHTFASILKPAPTLPERTTTKLTFIRPTTRNGRYEALINQDTINKMEKKFFCTFLVRRLTDERINPRFAKNFVKHCWGIEGHLFNIQIQRSRIFLIQFRKTEDYMVVKQSKDT